MAIHGDLLLADSVSSGRRRNVNQRYVLQANLNVSRPALATHAPGLSGLLLPGMAPIATQYPKQQQQNQQQGAPQQQQTPGRQQQRSSTPSSPTLRGRQPQANPNFGPPASNITTRLPTPVRINAASPGPSPSPTSMALALPKPPSPSRSLSQSGATPLANPFAYGSACSSPAISTATSNIFMLPTPPSILDKPPPSALRSAAHQTNAARAAAPCASSAAAQSGQSSLTTPTSTRPSPQPPERSILASIQLPSSHNQQLRGTTFGSTSGAALPGHSEGLAPVVAPAPALAAASGGVAAVSPVLSAPTIQAALQQALAGAVERKPEAFRVDNFERFFDSLMHPGNAGKLDGPLPDELPDDVRYGDNWYKHCRDWNLRNQPSAPYSAPTTATAACAGVDADAAAAAPATPVSCCLARTPFAAEMPQTEERDQQQKPQWGLDEPPMSEACCKALDIAHHGLSKVLTPTARSRSVSLDATPVAGAAAPSSAHRAFAQPSLLERFQQQRHLLQGASTAAAAAEAGADLEDKAVSRPQPAAGPEVAHTVAALTSALETLARDQAVAAAASGVLAVPEAITVEPASPHGALGVTAAAAAQDATTPRADLTDAAEVAAAVDDAALEISPRITPVRGAWGAAARPPAAGRRFAVPMLLISSIDGVMMLPTAAGAALSPPPDSARPPSTAATTPGHKTPRGGGGGAADSVVTTAATTPVGRAATPTTARAAASATSPMLESAQVAVAMATTHEPEASAAPLRKLSRELAAAEVAAEHHAVVPLTQQPLLATTSVPSVAALGVAPADAAPATADDTPAAVLWSPAFPSHAPTVAMPRSGAVAAAAAGAVPQRSSSPVTLLHNAPRDMPTPNPAFFSGAPAPAAGPSSLAAAVAAVAAPGQAVGAAAAQGLAAAAGPSTSSAPAAADPLKEIVVGIEKLSTLKQNILAEDKEVDVASITQMIQLKLAVEQLLARTSTAVQDSSAAVSLPPQEAAADAAPAALSHSSMAPAQAEQAVTPKKQSKSGAFGAFLKSVFSPRSGSASKAQAAATSAAPQAPPPVKGAATAAATALQAAVASPSTTAVGVRAPRPMSASAVPRQAASPSLADRSRYAALHQRAAARLAEAAAEPAAAPRPVLAPAAAPGASRQAAPQRGDVWQRYEEKIAMHRHQLDTTKTQLDEAVRKLNDMQAEFDELLLCLGMESAKNKALCEAMRAAGLDPEPILAAIEEQWMGGAFQ
ncbi:hypothetical protein PLESTB_001030200 [Pleodorina starrii]|uniref:Uncharacterized protein n=1 Tax=Pleodorina starrii TaxID=330485 RepID=A0A9W6F4X3_9CHLO|nr:hypothetical protein PLESTB_001030200 [Pleodorina starrii]